jgi:outer membrane lipoprotein-sorting protein
MTGSNPTHRDEELGAALRELEVPEHRASFYSDLHHRLAEERLESLTRTRHRRQARRTRLRWGFRVAALAVVAAIVLVAIGIPGTNRTPSVVRGPEQATAATIKAKVQAALATMRNMSGQLVSDGPEKGDERRWQFALTASGDFALLGPADGEKITYDASSGVVRSAQRSASMGGDTLFYAVRRGVAPGPPDLGAPTWIIPEEFAAFVRALLAAEDPRVREISYEGRPAWRLDIDVVPNAIVPAFSGDRLEITVDQATGMPVRVLETNDGAFWREIRIEGLVVNTDLSPDTFRLEFPPGAEVMRSDDGFERVDLNDVAGIVGYGPLVPAQVPDGYKLAEVAVAKESPSTGSEAANPPSRMVVSLSYRRGLDQFLVTTRLARVLAEGEPALPLEKLWGDPLATGEGYVDESEQLTLHRGALAGQQAKLVLVPRGIPHVWALTDKLVVTVGGDLSRAELMTVTESLTTP